MHFRKTLIAISISTIFSSGINAAPVNVDSDELIINYTDGSSIKAISLPSSTESGSTDIGYNNVKLDSGAGFHLFLTESGSNGQTFKSDEIRVSWFQDTLQHTEKVKVVDSQEESHVDHQKVVDQAEKSHYEDKKVVDLAEKSHIEHQKVVDQAEKSHYEDKKVVDSAEKSHIEHQKVVDQAEKSHYEDKKVHNEDKDGKDSIEHVKIIDQDEKSHYVDKKVIDTPEQSHIDHVKIVDQDEKSHYVDNKVIDTPEQSHIDHIKIVDQDEKSHYVDTKVIDKEERSHDENVTKGLNAGHLHIDFLSGLTGNVDPSTCQNCFTENTTLGNLIRLSMLSGEDKNQAGKLFNGLGISSFTIKSDDLQDHVVATPVPTAIWLFGSALPLLMGFTRRKKTK